MSELFYGIIDNPGNPFAGDGSAPDPTTDQPVDPTDAEADPTGATDMTRRIDLGHVYHVPGNSPTKCDENSERGIRYAHRHGWSIDIDMQKDKEGNILMEHWQELMLKDGWFDPEGKLDKHRSLNTLTPAEWSRLTTKHGDRLMLMTEGLRLCGKLGVKVRAEPKAGNAWTLTDAQLLHGVAQEAGTKVVIATLTTDPHWRHRLSVFRQAGFHDTRKL